MTAAHCLRGSDIIAHVGIDANGEFYDSINITAEGQFIHQEYNKTSIDNDIGKTFDLLSLG